MCRGLIAALASRPEGPGPIFLVKAKDSPVAPDI